MSIRFAFSAATTLALASLLTACAGPLGPEGKDGDGGSPDQDASGDSGVPPDGCPAGTVPVGESCAPVGDDLGTDWHPDPDGDGFPSAGDACPHVYDPSQQDGDGDGRGDACDPDAVTVVPGGAIVDLRAEHVTPYGAWLTFTSPHDTPYGWDALVAWSTDPSDLATAAAIDALPDAQRRSVSVDEPAGHGITKPIIVTSLEPDTTYYVTARRLYWDGLSDDAGNVIELRTAPAPLAQPLPPNPRVMATPAILDDVRARHESGDATFATWREVLEGAASSSAGSDQPHEFAHCNTLALLYHATGEASYRDAAAASIAAMAGYWEANELEGNQLRWANARLGACVDLLWNDIDAGLRERAVEAFLTDDEHASVKRFGDTDEVASTARVWILDGLVACDGAGLDPELAARGCAVLERGLRLVWGVQLVKARRDEGFYAQSGGTLPDGIWYGHGTARYWMETLWALGNAGADVDTYATWVWHDHAALLLHPLTPARRGYASFGDLDAYDNFDLEPNSVPIDTLNGVELPALHMALLARAGMDEKAGVARWHIETVLAESDAAGGWAMLAFAHDGLAARDPSALPPFFWDSGADMLYARTGWDEDASLVFFRGGWSGVDHHHEDLGAFQLYRRGRWITHEVLGYGGPASSARGHNVLLVDDRQYAMAAGGTPRIARVSRGAGYTFAAADLTGVYTSADNADYEIARVERHLVWLAGDDDRVIVYDVIDGGGDRERTWQLHLDAAPAIDGSRAELMLGDTRVELALVHPPEVTLDAAAPEGVPGNYPGEIYTHRVLAPLPGDEALRVVSVLRAADAGAEPASAGAGDGAAHLAARTAADVVVFPRAGLASEGEGGELVVAGPRPARVVWTGLAPGQGYEVTIAEDPAGWRIAAVAGGGSTADAAGVVIASP